MRSSDLPQQTVSRSKMVHNGSAYEADSTELDHGVDSVSIKDCVFMQSDDAVWCIFSV